MKALQFGKCLVIDLECLAWETKEDQGNLQSEIIEIGLCVLDTKTLEISRKTSCIIRPEHSKPSEYCTKLTGLTWDDVKVGMPLLGGVNKLIREYGSRNRIWFSWGGGDRAVFDKECSEKNIEYPFSSSHFDLSSMYSVMAGKNMRIGLSNALSKIGLEFKGRQHSGADDAYNTARILRYMIKRFRK